MRTSLPFARRAARVLALPILLLAAPKAFAADLFVGPGQPFTTVQAAVDAASPGDRVFVAPGIYQAFTVDKPIEVRGAGPGQTRITNIIVDTRVQVTDIQAGRVATLAGMSISHSNPQVLGDYAMVEILGNGGTVVLHNVQVNAMPMSYHRGPGVLVADSARVLIQGCDLRGASGFTQFGGVGDAGLVAQDSKLWISDSRLRATNASYGEFTFAQEGAPGARFTGCEVRLARTEARGGSGSYDQFLPGPAPGGPGIELVGSSLVLAGGPGNLLQGAAGFWDTVSNSSGGAGLRLTADSAVESATDALLVGGLDGLASTPAPALEVDGTSTATALPQRLPTLAPSAQTVALGGSLQLELSGEPGAIAVPTASGLLGATLHLPGIEGPILIDVTAYTALPPVLLDPAGTGTRGLSVPANPILAGSHLWLQSAELAAGTLRISNPARLSLSL
jgi:hypothetical protein